MNSKALRKGATGAGQSSEHMTNGYRRTRSDHAQETAEDYVELIDDLIREAGEARAVDVARRLGPLIVERLGSEVVYTRQDDRFVPLETRTAIANEKRSDLFISIHVNSSRSRSARGIETYYLNFTTDAEALEVAARENAVSQESIYQLQDLVQRIAQQEKMGESKEFAARIQSALWKTIGNGARRMKNRGVKKAPFVVLIGANMPSVLAEVAFLSNPQDEKLLRTDEHRQKIAEALYAGIEEYVDSLSGVKVARSEDSPSLAAR